MTVLHIQPNAALSSSYTIRPGMTQPDHLPGDSFHANDGSQGQSSLFQWTHILLSAQKPPLCPQYPQDDEDFWRIRWRTVTRLYKWNAHAAEAAHLLSLAHMPTTARYSTEWLLSHNRAELPDPTQCALCQRGPDTQDHRFFNCDLIAPLWPRWTRQEAMSGPLATSRAAFHATVISAEAQDALLFREFFARASISACQL
ncbi:hypothetical protein V1514DRAFT_330426 [Lipomyces japonicus]|uniref:uncharacterized protein n=1 Tax=Lipomyces japonicus TaxID=56871 RepID=UPI0034CF85EE